MPGIASNSNDRHMRMKIFLLTNLSFFRFCFWGQQSAAGAIVASLGVGALAEGVEIGDCGVVAEIEDGLGIDGIAHVSRLEVQVWACAAAGVAAQCDGSAGLHVLAGLDQKARQVAIDGLEAIGVAHDHVEAIASALKAGEAHTAGECGTHGVADGGAQVDTLVGAAELGAVAVRRGDHTTLDGHAEVAHVDALGAGHVAVFVRIDQVALPALGVDVGLGLFVLIEVLCVFLSLFEADALVDALLLGEHLGMSLAIA